MKYFRNTSWMLAEQLLRMIAGLFVGIWVARYLGPAQFGVFSYALAFTTIFTGFAKLGLDGIVVRELIKYPEDKYVYLGTAFWLKVFGGIFALVIVAIFIFFTGNTEVNQFIFIITAGLVFQGFEVIDFYFQSMVLAKFVSICKVIQLAISSLVKIYLVLNKAELIYFVWVSLFDQITLAVSLLSAYQYKNSAVFFRIFDLKIAKSLLKDSWPLMLSALVTMIYMRIDQIMIKEMLGEHDVGIYSAAVRLSEVWYFIPVIITTSLFPAIIKAKEVSAEIYLQRMQRLYTFVVWLAISIAISMTFISNWLVVFLYGESYRLASQVLMIHIWTSVFVFLGVSSGKWLLNENLQHLAFFRTFYGLLINVALNYFLIKKYGINGAALSALVSQCFATYLSDLFNKKTINSFIMKSKALFLFRVKQC
jgi:O-antigen/teichoic acid export membrane protein